MFWVTILAAVTVGPPPSAPTDSGTWETVFPNGDFYSIQTKDIKLGERDRRVWVYGDHSGNSKVPYRSSLQFLYFACDGFVRRAAFNTYDSKGNQLTQWNGYQAPEPIPPRTMSEWAETIVCAQK